MKSQNSFIYELVARHYRRSFGSFVHKVGDDVIDILSTEGMENTPLRLPDVVSYEFTSGVIPGKHSRL